MNSKIEKIVVKYLTNSATVSDLNELSDWIESPHNKDVFKEYVKTHFAINYAINEPDTDLAVEQLLQAIKKEKSFVYKIKQKPFYKYIAAASVVLLISLTLIFNNKSKENTSQDTTIVNSKIVPGTDKATLTLANGEHVSLAKGSSFKTQHVNSNGEKIIYSGNTNPTAETAYNYLTIPRGGQFYVVLSDSTQVWLNSESQLKYPVAFADGRPREVELVYGEAYFIVSPSTKHNGAKFKVFNKSQEVEVLGTQFNIKAYKDEHNVYTTLVEGKVAVDIENNKKFLEPDQQLKLNKITSGVSVSKVDVKSIVSWKDGVFSFKGKPLKDIVRVISRWYDVDIIFENRELKDIKFKGVLGKDQDIQDILDAIKTLSAITDYSIKDKTVILK